MRVCVLRPEGVLLLASEVRVCGSRVTAWAGNLLIPKKEMRKHAIAAKVEGALAVARRTRRSPYPYAVRVRLPKIILNMVSSVERCGLPLPQGEEDHPSALCTACSFRTEYILAHTTRLSPQSDDEEARGTKPRSLPAVSVLMPTVGDCLV